MHECFLVLAYHSIKQCAIIPQPCITAALMNALLWLPQGFVLGCLSLLAATVAAVPTKQYRNSGGGHLSYCVHMLCTYHQASQSLLSAVKLPCVVVRR